MREGHEGAERSGKIRGKGPVHHLNVTMPVNGLRGDIQTELRADEVACSIEEPYNEVMAESRYSFGC